MHILVIFIFEQSLDFDGSVYFVFQMRETWEDVRVYVIRPAPVDEYGPCANHMPSDDEKVVSLFTSKFCQFLLAIYWLLSDTVV